MVISRKKTLIVVISITSLILFSICYCRHMKKKQLVKDLEDVMRISISFGPPSTYYCILKNDNTLTCYYGLRSGVGIESDDFLTSFEENGTINLNLSEGEYIKNLINNLQQDPPTDKRRATDSWYVMLSYNNSIYEVDYLWNDSDTLDKIIDELVRLKPIDINLTLTGWPH